MNSLLSVGTGSLSLGACEWTLQGERERVPQEGGEGALSRQKGRTFRLRLCAERTAVSGRWHTCRLSEGGRRRWGLTQAAFREGTQPMAHPGLPVLMVAALQGLPQPYLELLCRARDPGLPACKAGALPLDAAPSRPAIRACLAWWCWECPVSTEGKLGPLDIPPGAVPRPVPAGLLTDRARLSLCSRKVHGPTCCTSSCCRTCPP